MKTGETQPRYRMQPDGAFVIESYHQAPPVASFLPGVAGLRGIPLWCFYVNRGQGVASFGTRNKDNAILEFWPANKAYQNTPLLGFRTFLKFRGEDKAHEPFQSWGISHGEGVSQEMRVTSYDLQLKEVNAGLGLEISVRYFTVPNEPFAALARVLTVKNTAKTARHIELLDGLPQIVPYGMNNWILKNMSRTGEAWVGMTNLEETGVPYFKLKVEVSDTPQVTQLHEGHFYLSVVANGNETRLAKVVADPSLVFGQRTDFSWAEKFYAGDAAFEIPQHQVIDNKMPGAFAHAELELKPGEQASLYTLMGQIRGEHRLNKLLPMLATPQFFKKKEEENRRVTEAIQSGMETKSASPAFNHYCRQSYLDNALRGGIPHPVATQNGPFVFHVYWRKHGDLERDYNHFEVLPTYYAQGNANYRDVNQNRRMDPWFNPLVGDSNIVTFLNMLQLDGYNPLVLKSVKFQLRDDAAARAALKPLFGKYLDAVYEICRAPLTPGAFVMALEEKKIEFDGGDEKMLGAVLSHSDRIQEIDPSEGFWVDHWHYNLDLLESYLGLFPEKWRELLVEKRQFTFYDSPLFVRPRREKYVLDGGRPRQFHAIHHDKEKEAALSARKADPGKVRTQHGKGKVYHTNLLAKLTTLLVNKLATLDPFGAGVEMEADRPNWYDALNGLPGLFGSSVSETFELKRLIRFLQTAIEEAGLSSEDDVALPEEVMEFLKAVERELPNPDPFIYWDKTSAAKERYREKTRRGISGKEKAITFGKLKAFLEKAADKVERGLEKAWSKKEGAYVSYFVNDLVEWKELGRKNEKGMPLVAAKKFRQHPLPLFLEGMAHALRTETNPARARTLHAAVKGSDLYDKKLGMYKVNASIQKESLDLGRTRVFSPGWLENGSVFMHMEFKYLLEMLRAGLAAEFFEDLKKALPAFMNPAVYGRSPAENSTFIASSANPDTRVHGRGFVARLSGTNAEWLQIWVMMGVGKNPFRLNASGELEFAPQPLLPGWLFSEKEKSYSFRFLGKTEFAYVNPQRKNTFGRNAAKVKSWKLEAPRKSPVQVRGEKVSGELARRIRDGKFSKITVRLG